jgi:membrane-associated phospholipid phosphatase
VDHAVVRQLPTGHASGTAGFLLSVSGVLATFATPELFVALTLAVAACWSWRERSAEVLRITVIAVTVLSASVLAGKALLHRPGPPGSAPHHLFGYYPSGHTTTAAVCVGTLALLAGRRRPSQRAPLLTVAALWTVVVGAAMVIHRYHWPSDVLAGLLLGSLILLLVDHLSRRPGRSARLREA